ncbi:MAG: alpha/beta hydrolase, partial [Microbacteriaceae bacterium]|nr:alpha/beta hydrolase [Microbacteriaceae bacterium]
MKLAHNAHNAHIRPWFVWAVRIIAVAGLVVVAWACLSGWGAVVHGHPAYAVLLAVSFVLSAVAIVRSLRARPIRSGWRIVLRIIVSVLAIAGIALVAWLRPFSAEEPALAAMQPDSTVTVIESPTRIVLEPAGTPNTTAVFFEAGAKVEARAYAAVLRPLAEAGFTVVIAKQPLAIAFLSLPDFDGVRSDFPGVDRWVLGGHSLGGVVATIQADDGDSSTGAPVVGLFLYASYPASDVSSSLAARVLSVSASNDGLATPVDVDSAKPLLPSDTTYTVIPGAVHAFFADYGAQPGDGTPTVSHREAREEIAAATLDFVRGVS